MKLYSEIFHVNRIFMWQFKRKKIIEQQLRCDIQRLIAIVTSAVIWNSNCVTTNLRNKNKYSMTPAAYSLEFSNCQGGDHFYSVTLSNSLFLQLIAVLVSDLDTTKPKVRLSQTRTENLWFPSASR